MTDEAPAPAEEVSTDASVDAAPVVEPAAVIAPVEPAPAVEVLADPAPEAPAEAPPAPEPAPDAAPAVEETAPAPELTPADVLAKLDAIGEQVTAILRRGCGGLR